jgi:Uma2 family endonuclease
MTTAGMITTAEQLCEEAAGIGRCELVRGELRMMSPAGSRHGAVALRIATLLANHVDAHGLGQVFAAETGFILARNPDTVRAPDVAFVGREWLAAGTRLVWVVDPADRSFTAHAAAGTVHRMVAPAAAPAGDVVPGFMLMLDSVLG